MKIFELQDVSTGWAVGVGLFIIVLFCGLIGAAGLFFKDNLRLQINAYEAYTLPSETSGARPGAWTSDDLRKYRFEEETKLKTYSWNDASKTDAVVPLSRAIDLAIEKKILVHHDGAENVR